MSVGVGPSLQSLTLHQDNRGRIWAFTDRGVACLENDRFIPVIPRPGGVVYSSAADDAGNLWASDQNQGLIRLRGESVVERVPWAKLGLRDVATALFPDPVQGGLWLGFLGGGVTYFKDGQVRASYAVADGLGAGRVSGLHLDRDGTLWAATEGGLSRVKNNRVATLTSRNGLPCDAAKWVMEDDARSFWLYTACGLVRIARSELDGWVNDPRRTVRTTVFDDSDGVRSHAFTNGTTPRVSPSPRMENCIRFPAFRRRQHVIDPRHIPMNKLPPPVHIEQITSDRKTHDDASSKLRLPALSRDLEIDYNALSLVAPEKNRFKYKLEGWDRDWQDVGNRRQAFYDNLPPRNYRFRVIASNNNGVWNEAGDTLDFSIDPAYFQTTWFRASCVAAFFALLWAAYRYRLHQVRAGIRGAAGAVSCTRIARELHDTLLQSFQGSLLVMGTARNLLSRRPEQAGQTLDKAISHGGGRDRRRRDAIPGLTLPTRGFRAILAQFADRNSRVKILAQSMDASGNPVIFRVAVEEVPERTLDPVIIQDEAHRMRPQCCRNVFPARTRFSQIEVDIRYDGPLLRVLIRDDGKGIEPEIVKAGGREGHWGLLGIRERAKRIGARLAILERGRRGHRVELSIPAADRIRGTPRRPLSSLP